MNLGCISDLSNRVSIAFSLNFNTSHTGSCKECWLCPLQVNNYPRDPQGYMPEGHVGESRRDQWWRYGCLDSGRRTGRCWQKNRFT